VTHALFFALVPSENNPEAEERTARLIDRYGNDVLRVSYLYLRDRQLAEDAFQEVYLKAYRKYKSFRGLSSEKTWLLRITVNVCKDMLRTSWRKRMLPGLPPEMASESPGPERIAFETDEYRRLREAVLALSPPLKDAVILYYYKSLDTAEIAKVLRIREGTVRNRLHRARHLLKRCLERRGAIEWIR